MPKSPLPSQIKLHKKSRTLELIYAQDHFELTAEYLRVHSPSAAVRGHGVGNGTLQTGKQWVGIKELIPNGNYALKIVFDDGHDSGIYTWDYLYDLSHNAEQYWEKYLQNLQAAGASRNDGLIMKA